MKLVNSLFLALIAITFISCIEKNIALGQYTLSNSDETDIAEILEIKANQEFVFSGLKNEKGNNWTWVIEGNWKQKNDSIILNSNEINMRAYGNKMNYEYLSNYTDSIKYIDQEIIACRNLTLHFEKNKIYYKQKNKISVYSRTN